MKYELVGKEIKLIEKCGMFVCHVCALKYRPAVCQEAQINNSEVKSRPIARATKRRAK